MKSPLRRDTRRASEPRTAIDELAENDKRSGRQGQRAWVARRAQPMPSSGRGQRPFLRVRVNAPTRSDADGAGFSLRKSIATLATTTLLTHGVNSLMVLALARLYAPADLGTLSNVISLATILAPVCSLQLALAIPQERSDRAVAEIVVGCLMATMGIGLVVSALALLSPLGVSLPSGAWLGGLLLIPFVVAFDLSRLVAARAGAFRSLGGQNVSQAIGRGVVQVIGGLVSPGVAPLVAAEIVGRAVSLAAVGRACARLFAGLSWADLRPFAMFRKQFRFFLVVTPSSLLDNLGGYLPPILMAQLHGAESAGHYFLAQRIVSLPIVLIIQSTVEIVQVRAAQIARDDPAALRGFVGRAIGALLALGIATAAALGVFLMFFWRLALGDGWEEARTMAFILMAPGFLQCVSGPLTRILVATGRQAYKFAFDGCFLIAGLLPAIAAFLHFDATTMGDVSLIGVGYVVAYLVYVGVIWLAAAHPAQLKVARTAG